MWRKYLRVIISQCLLAHLSTKTDGDHADIDKQPENYVLLTKLQDSFRFWYVSIAIHICTTCLPAESQQPQIHVSTFPVILYRYVGKSLPETNVTETQVVYLFNHKMSLEKSSYRGLPGFNNVWSGRIVSTGQKTKLPALYGVMKKKTTRVFTVCGARRFEGSCCLHSSVVSSP